MIGKVFNAPQEVFESGLFIVVGRDTDPVYNATRRPWFLQVREYVNGVPSGSWVPVTLAEFQEWNPDVPVTSEQWLASGNTKRATKPC